MAIQLLLLTLNTLIDLRLKAHRKRQIFLLHSSVRRRLAAARRRRGRRRGHRRGRRLPRHERACEEQQRDGEADGAAPLAERRHHAERQQREREAKEAGTQRVAWRLEGWLHGGEEHLGELQERDDKLGARPPEREEAARERERRDDRTDDRAACAATRIKHDQTQIQQQGCTSTAGAREFGA